MKTAGSHDTRFELERPLLDLPPAFAIVTGLPAWDLDSGATGGLHAPLDLLEHLRDEPRPRLIVPWVPLADGGLRAAAGWLVACAKARAVELGRAYGNDAVWWVDGDALNVVPCRSPEAGRTIAPGFRARLCHRSPPQGFRRAAGGVVVHPDGERVLLRRPAPNPGFDDLEWTFAKGRLDGEPVDVAALREVREELGVEAEILHPIPGWFLGLTTANHYFVMRWRADVQRPDFETAEVRWATWAQAPALMRLGRNRDALERDVRILQAARWVAGMSSGGRRAPG